MRSVFIILFTLVIGQVTMASPYLQTIGKQPLDGWVMDVWGYVDEQGIEYALVGMDDTLPGHKLNVIELSNPSQPILISSIEAMAFDIKTWRHYAYGVTGSDGMGTITDLSNPHQPVVVGEFTSGHNHFIDQRGYLYVARPGIRIYDLNLDPTAPALIWEQGDGGHDIVVVDTVMYDFHEAEATNIWSVAEPSAPHLLSQIIDPTIVYSHSGWPSKDGSYLFICDELARESIPDITVWDISDLENPTRVGNYLDPTATVHNLMVIGDHAFTSYYAAGTRIFDVSDPTRLNLIAEFDPNDHENEDFGGSFGVYPFLPSGLILASESEFGLCVYSINDTLEMDAADDTRIFPNPVQRGSSVKVEARGHFEKSHIHISNTFGEQVYATQDWSTQAMDFATIETKGLAAGVYFVTYLTTRLNGQFVIIGTDKLVVVNHL